MAIISTLEGFVIGRMKEKKVSKAELAQIVCVKTTQTLNTKLEGTSELSLREAQSLANFCGVSIEDICSLAFES
jgi:DNA-binding XRE family transcriptional regulator